MTRDDENKGEKTQDTMNDAIVCEGETMSGRVKKMRRKNKLDERER